MIVPRKLKTFTDQYPLVGPLIWILSFEYFIVQLIVALDWKYPYSITRNTISDLGNTNCGIYGARYVCSPLHSLMNASFIMLGTFMMLGSILIYQEFKETRWSLAGFSLMFLAGVGTLMVGSFPENTVSGLHVSGAFLGLFIGNVAIVSLGTVLNIPRSIRIYSITSGVVSLISLGLFFTHNYIGIGLGGTERLAGYPQTLWLIIFGFYISKNHYVRSKKGSLI